MGYMRMDVSLLNRWTSTSRTFWLVLSLSFITAIAGCAMQSEKFDSAAWKSERGMSEADMTRVGMLSKLEKELKPGMPREDVLELLGPPDDSTKDGSVDTYLLGIGMSPDPQYYKLTYKDGALTSSKRLVY
jgi:hypothetical protein